MTFNNIFFVEHKGDLKFHKCNISKLMLFDQYHTKLTTFNKSTIFAKMDNITAHKITVLVDDDDIIDIPDYILGFLSDTYTYKGKKYRRYTKNMRKICEIIPYENYHYGILKSKDDIPILMQELIRMYKDKIDQHKKVIRKLQKNERNKK